MDVNMTIWTLPPFPFWKNERNPIYNFTRWNKVCELEYDAAALGEGSEANENGRIDRIKFQGRTEGLVKEGA